MVRIQDGMIRRGESREGKMKYRRDQYDFRRLLYSQLPRYIAFDPCLEHGCILWKEVARFGTKCTDKFSAIVLSIIFFANVQGGEDEDPGGFGSLVNPEPGGIVVRPDMDLKKTQRSNDANGLFQRFIFV